MQLETEFFGICTEVTAPNCKNLPQIFLKAGVTKVMSAIGDLNWIPHGITAYWADKLSQNFVTKLAFVAGHSEEVVVCYSSSVWVMTG